MTTLDADLFNKNFIFEKSCSWADMCDDDDINNEMFNSINNVETEVKKYSEFCAEIETSDCYNSESVSSQHDQIQNDTTLPSSTKNDCDRLCPTDSQFTVVSRGRSNGNNLHKRQRTGFYNHIETGHCVGNDFQLEIPQTFRGNGRRGIGRGNNANGNGRGNNGRGNGRGNNGRGNGSGNNDCFRTDDSNENRSLKLPNNSSIYWNIPINLNFYSHSNYSNAITNRVSESLLSLKEKISQVVVWPDVWRQAIEMNWVLGRINQACVLKYFSRAFFKLVEINANTNIIPPVAVSTLLKTAHIGEAPGGFIQAVRFCRDGMSSAEHVLEMLDGQNSSACGIESYAVSLLGDPWPSVTISNASRVFSFNIATDEISRNQFIETVGRTRDFVTADGGFEVPSERRAQQEQIMLDLLKGEISIIFKILTVGGNALIKFFSIDLQETRCLILQLYQSFNYVSITIPISSKPTNDERYIVAIGFKQEVALQETVPDDWNNWFSIYSTEDKLRQIGPLTSAIDFCSKENVVIPVQPALNNAKNFCITNGLPLKILPYPNSFSNKK
jgi:23S rRNA U2552 (ribose-2'-O)-methylase RlmE/FtsJ